MPLIYYIYPTVIVVLLVSLVLIARIKMRSIEKKGIRVVGTIIENRESGDGRIGRTDNGKFGANINMPTIKFTTLDGKEIVGQPVIEFASEFELPVPSEIYIKYTPENPGEFCVDIS
jgi:hypothetical protein